MDEKEIIRTLKSERCPPSVLRQVQETIRSEKPSVTGWRWGVPVGVSAALVVLLSLIFFNLRDDSIVSVDETAPAPATVEDYLVEAEKLKFALAYIGLKLAEETERNRDIIFSRTVPVVMDSIENTEKYINNKVGGKRSS